MYLVLPFCFFLLRRFNRLYVVLALWLGAALLAVVATQPALPRMFHGAVFPPMFIGGMVAYKLLQENPEKPRLPLIPAWGWPFFVIGLLVLKDRLVGGHNFETQLGAGVNAFICLLLGLAIPAFAELHAGWFVRPAQQVAKYSYGIYLLHVPVLIFVLRYLPALPLALKITVFVALTALLSFISFHAIEDPLIRFGKRLTSLVQAAHTPTFVASPEPVVASWSNLVDPSELSINAAEGASTER
jgi:peptidoglycan/LPS O-acetylase OafA/YrhL